MASLPQSLPPRTLPWIVNAYMVSDGNARQVLKAIITWVTVDVMNHGTRPVRNRTMCALPNKASAPDPSAVCDLHNYAAIFVRTFCSNGHVARASVLYLLQTARTAPLSTAIRLRPLALWTRYPFRFSLRLAPAFSAWVSLSASDVCCMSVRDFSVSSALNTGYKHWLRPSFLWSVP
jgi:hypothetical protein